MSAWAGVAAPLRGWLLDWRTGGDLQHVLAMGVVPSGWWTVGWKDGDCRFPMNGVEKTVGREAHAAAAVSPPQYLGG
tara:strand:- start:41782 stop:42012 length:231 start_codon:yes stop_codon:yes gene_type:complete